VDRVPALGDELRPLRGVPRLVVKMRSTDRGDEHFPHILRHTRTNFCVRKRFQIFFVVFASPQNAER
jgi:hypothetical protein